MLQKFAKVCKKLLLVFSIRIFWRSQLCHVLHTYTPWQWLFDVMLTCQSTDLYRWCMASSPGSWLHQVVRPTWGQTPRTTDTRRDMEQCIHRAGTARRPFLAGCATLMMMMMMMIICHVLQHLFILFYMCERLNEMFVVRRKWAYCLMLTPALVNAWVGLSVASMMCVCVRVWVPAVKEKRLELSTPNLVHILYRRTSACIDLEVKRSKVKVIGLWSVLPAYRHACRYDCLGF